MAGQAASQTPVIAGRASFRRYFEAATLRIRPRQQILDVWHSLLFACYADGRWTWGSGARPDSISDAEQLLCLLHPISEIESFGAADPDWTRSDVLAALRPLGGVRRIPRAITEIAIAFFDRHTDDEGRPRFSCAGFRALDGGELPTSEQRGALTVVDAYARSVKLSLAVLAFVKRRLTLEVDASSISSLNRLRDQASVRLTAAMAGLLRSFVVNSFEPDSPPGQAVLAMVRRPGYSDNELVRQLGDRLRQVLTQLRDDVRIAVSEADKPDEDQLFEIGWTWGIAAGAAQIDLVDTPTATAVGYADARPSLYFTVSALDGIDDLLSRRTRALSVMDEEQRHLAEALALRWDLTQRYWSALARFDSDHWPLADLPWRTSDGEESDYFSLLVLSIVIKDFVNRSFSPPEMHEAVVVVEELAQRGRITRRMSYNDVALTLHHPGVPIRLYGSDHLGPPLVWFEADYAPLLLKRTFQAIQLTSKVDLRERLTFVAEATMDHLYDRRLDRGLGAGLWDNVSGLPGHHLGPEGELSWSHSEKVVEALVMTAKAYVQDPPRSTRMAEIAMRLLNEADHVYNQELLEVDANDMSALRSGLDEIEHLIDRARELQSQRVNTSIALAERALLLLDNLAQARQDATRGR